jgi:hypothetical protein
MVAMHAAKKMAHGDGKGGRNFNDSPCQLTMPPLSIGEELWGVFIICHQGSWKWEAEFTEVNGDGEGGALAPDKFCSQKRSLSLCCLFGEGRAGLHMTMRFLET